MQKKKNGFLLFCLSFIPGAGEMYMGFMKMGLSLLIAFTVSMFICSITNIPELALFGGIICIYSFFHAHNIAGLDDEKFNSLKDEYLFGEETFGKMKNDIGSKYRTLSAIVLILFGLIVSAKAVLDILWDYLEGKNPIVKALSVAVEYCPRCIVGVAIIVAGVILLVGKKEKNPELTDDSNVG